MFLAGQNPLHVGFQRKQQLAAHVDVAVMHWRNVPDVVRSRELPILWRRTIQCLLHVRRVPNHHDVAQQCQRGRNKPGAGGADR